jgi:DNA phosphorothioation-dependent restriction protein DptG
MPPLSGEYDLIRRVRDCTTLTLSPDVCATNKARAEQVVDERADAGRLYELNHEIILLYTRITDNS